MTHFEAVVHSPVGQRHFVAWRAMASFDLRIIDPPEGPSESALPRVLTEGTSDLARVGLPANPSSRSSIVPDLRAHSCRLRSRRSENIGRFAGTMTV
jgi:hypothetical protein